MKKWKILTIFLSIGFVLALVGCLVFAYRWIDTSITLAYTNSSYDTASYEMEFSDTLLEREWIGMPKQELLDKLKAEEARRGDTAYFKTDENGIVWFCDLGCVGLEFEAGKLKKLH